MLFGFILGREYKLSIAEIFAVFTTGKLVVFDKELLILEGVNRNNILEKANNLGGTIKIIEIGNSNIVQDALKYEGKFKYGISVFGNKEKLKDILNQTKRDLKKAGISSRFVNKDFKNLTSAQIIGEKLITKNSDYNYIFISNTEKFIGKTIWIQDINAYSKRDFGKKRDMQIGMLPPKLAQIMINLGARNGKNSDNSSFLGQPGDIELQKIFDPFVGLGTILLESNLMGFKEFYGSDLNEKMVEYSKENLKKFLKKDSYVNHKNNISNYDFEKLNAKFIEESKFLNKADLIITEGYLGEIMTRKNISLDRINKQKDSLKSLYEKFFAGLKKKNFSGNIVISFPFREINGKYIYVNEIYEILKKYCTIEKLFPKELENLPTKIGSLLYKRENQLVGREIFKLKIR